MVPTLRGRMPHLRIGRLRTGVRRPAALITQPRRLIPHNLSNGYHPCRPRAGCVRSRQHSLDCLGYGNFFAAACAATMLGDLLRSVAEAGFVRRAGSSRCDARLPQALFLPPPSRQHELGVLSCDARRRGELRPCISSAPRSGYPADEMTDATATPRRIIVHDRRSQSDQ